LASNGRGSPAQKKKLGAGGFPFKKIFVWKTDYGCRSYFLRMRYTGSVTGDLNPQDVGFMKGRDNSWLVLR